MGFLLACVAAAGAYVYYKQLERAKFLEARLFVAVATAHRC